MLDHADPIHPSSIDVAPSAGGRRILLVSDSVGTPHHRRGIFHYTANLIEALARCGHDVTLLLEQPPLGPLSARIRDRLASLAAPAAASAELGTIFHYLSAREGRGAIGALARDYLYGRTFRRRATSATVRNDLKNIAYFPGDLDHLKAVRAFRLVPSVYSGALIKALCGMRAPAIDANGFDTVLIDTPTHLQITAPANAEIVAVIHDLIMLSEAAVNERWRRIFTSKLLTTITQATSLVFVSEATKSTFARLFPGFAGKPATVIYPSLPASFEPAGLPAVSPGMSSAKTFAAILADEPRKNLATLLEAFALLGDAYRLVVLGDVKVPDRSTPSHAFVCYSGYVSRSTKWRLLADCTGTIVPSFAEGFGIPLIEGAALGRAVFCSDIPIFREIAGDDAFYFDPTDAASIAGTITAYCQAPSLHEVRIARLNRRVLERFCADALVTSVAQRFGATLARERTR